MTKKGLITGINCLPMPETVHQWAFTRLLALIILSQLGNPSHAGLIGGNIATNSLVGFGTNHTRISPIVSVTQATNVAPLIITNITPYWWPPSYKIDGAGYFVVRDLLTGSLNATRFGAFRLDMDGFLVSVSGMRLQGYTNHTLNAVGDLRIETAGRIGIGAFVPPYFQSYEIKSNGLVVVVLSDNSSFISGQVVLQKFENPSQLLKTGNRLSSWSDAAEPLQMPVPPGNSGTGLLVDGWEQWAPKLQVSRIAGPPGPLTQGILVSTQSPSDLGIEGNGFFALRRTNDNARFATRAGAFYIDGDGFLIHCSGLRLQGYRDSARTTFGDLKVTAEDLSAQFDRVRHLEGFNVDRLGRINVYLGDGTTLVRGQVLLVDCTKSNLLERSSFDLFPITTDWTSMSPPLTGDLGWIVSGALEPNRLDPALLAVRTNLNFFISGPAMAAGPTDLAILGRGFFTVRDPETDISYATRLGGFTLDASGHLVTTNGLRLQGFIDAALWTNGDITIKAPGDANAPIDYSVDLEGRIWVTSGGFKLVQGQVLLQQYRNLQGLRPLGNGFFANLAAALPIFTNWVSDYYTSGEILGGYLELPPDPLPAPQIPPSNGWRIVVDDLDSGKVEGSSDMINWETVGQVSGSDLNSAELFDTSESNQRFYRLVRYE
jgi:flagellar hook protein FlgE